ncbi:prepilin-type N-terminal cleavage/methylation domain-containing protein [Solibacillus sp. CAU 1738]|uniref:PulJ/GspJ family protein n=1 Tax=Solibacillus sp. CAU 1738 TaxID=3140363 RepID=UPI0032610E9F
MNKLLKNQRGLTLLELLASIVLISMISIFIFSITTKAIENNRVIQQETMLRDEADIIVSKFIKTLYSTKQGYIIRNTTNSAGNSYIEVTNDLEKCQKNEDGNLINVTACNATLKPIGFKTVSGITKIYILDEVYSISHPNIQILQNSKVNGDPQKTSIYEIDLKLKITHKRGNKETSKEMAFTNQIQPVLTSK